MEDQPPVPPTLITDTSGAKIYLKQFQNKRNQLVLRATVGPAHAKEWFQKTQTGLVRSSVSSSVYSKVMGESRTAGRGGASLCTVALTMAVLITGRLGSLGGGGGKGHMTNSIDYMSNMYVTSSNIQMGDFFCLSA